MILLEDKGRDYRRWRHSPDETIFLQARGLQHVLSSNVSAVGVSDNDLIIRFHNGSLYQYPNMSDRFDDIMSSNSKGKWVWKYLRRAGVPYQKIGVMPFEDDVKVSDEEIFTLGNRFMALSDLPNFLELGAGTFKLLEGLNLNSINSFVKNIPVMGQITS